MTRRKKLFLVGGGIAAILLIIAVLLVFVFDVFNLYAYKYKLKYSDYVKAGTYKGLEYKQAKVSVSKAEVKAEIKSRLAAKATTKDLKQGTVKDGDTINISYEGKIDGKTFEGGSADNSSITIGQTSMIDGFTDGLIGAKVGSTVTLNLQFPKDYSEEKVAGKKVVFDITVNSKQVTTEPKYDLSFIKSNSNFDNKKDYEKSVKEDLRKSKQETEDSNVKTALWNQVVASSKMKKYPKKQLQYEQDQLIDRYKKMATSYSMEWDDFLKQYMNTTEKKFNKQARSYAKNVVKQKLVLHLVAEQEGISVSNKEYKQYLKDLLKNAGFTEDTFKQQYSESIEKYAKENDFRTNLLTDKVLDQVIKYGKKI